MGKCTAVPYRCNTRKAINMPLEKTITLRVRYPEVDAMGYVHHSRYLQYFELARVELLRSLGVSYADLERDGVLFVVVKASINYRNPAKYDDELSITTKVVKQTHVRYDHAYEVKRGHVILCDGTTTIACIDRDGKLREIPEPLASAGVPQT